MENANCNNLTPDKDLTAGETSILSDSEMLSTCLPSLAYAPVSPHSDGSIVQQSHEKASDTNFSQSDLIKDNKEWTSNNCDSEEKSGKRKRNTLTLQTKLEIIEKIKKGEKLNKLALEYGLGKATVSDIKRQEEKITSFISRSTCGTKTEKRKSMRKPNDVHLEKALNLWLSKERTKGNVISGPQLMQKAKSFYKDLYGFEDDSFKASSGWLQRFKLRNDIKHSRIREKRENGRKKKAGTNEDEVIQYQVFILRRFLQERGYIPEQIYIVSIDHLHWKSLPIKLNSKKYSKSCVNLVTCVNMVGNHKIRPSLVGTMESVSSIGQENSERLPFHYYYHQNGVMDGDLFETWFQSEFVAPVRLLHPQAVILIDGSFSNFDRDRFTSEDGKYSCVVLHPSLSILEQPITSCLFENVRWKYRCKLLERALSYSSKKGSNKRLAQLVRHVTLKDVGYILSEVFDATSGELIKKCCNISLYFLLILVDQYVDVADLSKKINDDNSICESDRLENIQNIKMMLRNCDCDLTDEDVIDWISIDGLNKSAMSDKDIIDTVRNDLTDSESEEESSGMKEKCANVPSNKEAFACFSKCLTWLENQEESDSSKLLLLWKLQNMAANKHFNGSYK